MEARNREELFRQLQPEEFNQLHIDQGIRTDGRPKLTEFRPISLSVGSVKTADGSAVVKQGETIVVCGVKLELAEPKVEEPSKGFLVINVDLPPLCHPQFKPGPPSVLAQNASTFLDETLRSSRFLDLQDLCLVRGKLVWVLFIDLVCLNFDGGVLDACCKAAVAALRNVKIPKVSFEKTEEDGAEGEVRVSEDEVEPLKLSEGHPVCCTMAICGDGTILPDPTEDEERLASSVVTVVLRKDAGTDDNDPDEERGDGYRLCGVRKPGGAPIGKEAMARCLGFARKRAKQEEKLLVSSKDA